MRYDTQYFDAITHLRRCRRFVPLPIFQCNLTIDEIWSFIERRPWFKQSDGQLSPLVDRNDATTWGEGIFPHDTLGLVGFVPSQTKQMWLNRQNQTMCDSQNFVIDSPIPAQSTHLSVLSLLPTTPRYEACKLVAGDEKLWVSLDRCGLMRPTRGVVQAKLVPDQVLVPPTSPLSKTSSPLP